MGSGGRWVWVWGADFCATVWSSRGRSQLSILRLRGEKAPCREVRYPLRNRNYCAFYPLPGHTFRCAFRPFLLVFFTRGRVGYVEVEVNTNT